MYSDLQISQVFTVSYMCKSALLNRETLSSEKKKIDGRFSTLPGTQHDDFSQN